MSAVRLKSHFFPLEIIELCNTLIFRGSAIYLDKNLSLRRMLPAFIPIVYVLQRDRRALDHQ